VILDSEIDMFTTVNQFTGKTLEQHWNTSVCLDPTEQEKPIITANELDLQINLTPYSLTFIKGRFKLNTRTDPTVMSTQQTLKGYSTHFTTPPLS